MRHRPADAARFVQRFSGNQHDILDYLTDEVLSHQSETVQYFLLQTSILKRMCSPLCGAVLDQHAADSQATLEQLEHANLFVIPLNDECGWYRYHHLFRDLLRTWDRWRHARSGGQRGRRKLVENLR